MLFKYLKAISDFNSIPNDGVRDGKMLSSRMAVTTMMDANVIVVVIDLIVFTIQIITLNFLHDSDIGFNGMNIACRFNKNQAEIRDAI